MRPLYCLVTISLLACCGCIVIRPQRLPTPEWRIVEGHWQRSAAAGQLTWSHEDPYLKGGALVHCGNFRSVSFGATLRFTSAALARDPWIGLIFAARAPLAYGPWGPGCLIQLHADGRLELQDMRNAGHAGPVRVPGMLLRPPLRLEAEARETTLTIHVDGRPVLSYQTSNPPLIGHVALVNYACTAEFRDVRLDGAPAPAQPRSRVHRAVSRPRKSVGQELPRIAACRLPGGNGEFHLTGSDEPFHPVGFNYTRIGQWSHATFNVGVYDWRQAERDMRAMNAAGANCIRVWAWGEQDFGGGNAGPYNSRGVNPEYMRNFIDFLHRAARHELHVLCVLDQCPLNATYRSLLEHTLSNDPHLLITGQNRQYMTREWITVKAAEIRDFIGYLKKAAPESLTTVFAWELANEAYANTTEGPFRDWRTSVELMNGQQYAMRHRVDRQRCWDDAISFYTRTLARAVRSADPRALVTIGFWTADAAGRYPFNGLPDDGRDPRVPPRPSILAQPESGLDFLDIHCYPWGDEVYLDNGAHERDAVRVTGIPVIAGEFGIFKQNYIDQKKARGLSKYLTDAIDAIGYQGALFWSWNVCDEGTWCWPELESAPLAWP